ncbi:MAG: hypothetical protein LOD87_10795, partial [Planifilum fulgidum]
MRNHYDLGRRRTDSTRRPATEAQPESIGLRGRRFPLWTSVFIASLLLATGTAVYAITAFTSPPPGLKSDEVLTGKAEDLDDETRDDTVGSINGKEEEDT